jgi:hypothetical protein
MIAIGGWQTGVPGSSPITTNGWKAAWLTRAMNITNGTKTGGNRRTRTEERTQSDTVAGASASGLKRAGAPVFLFQRKTLEQRGFFHDPPRPAHHGTQRIVTDFGGNTYFLAQQHVQIAQQRAPAG